MIVRWLLLLVLVGCVLPKTTDTTTPLERTAKRSTCAPLGALQIDATASHETVSVVATRSRRCSLVVWQRYAHHQATHAEIVGPDLSGGTPNDVGVVLGVVILDAPFFVLSAAFTGVVVAASPSHDEQYVKKLGVVAVEGPVKVAFLAVDVVLPSGATVHGVTDVQGVATVRVPEGEPERGVVVVRAGASETRLAYP